MRKDERWSPVNKLVVASGHREDRTPACGEFYPMLCHSEPYEKKLDKLLGK